MSTHQNTLDNRQAIVAACSGLLYRKGFAEMSFSDMAEASGVPRGNFYYYFKSKEQILQAVIDHRLQKMHALVAGWQEEFATPLERLKRYAGIPYIDRKEVLQFGCPMGSLNAELVKAHPALQKIARRQLDFFKDWLAKQFCQLRPDLDGQELALQLLIRSQGLSVMSAAYGDEQIIRQEIDRINQWLDGLQAQRPIS